MYAIRFCICAILSLSLHLPLYASQIYEVSYRQLPDEKNIYPYVPEPFLVSKLEDKGFSSLFERTYRKDVRDSNKLYGVFFDFKGLEDGGFEIVKDEFHSGRSPLYYTETIFKMTGNCINSYPSDSPDDNLELISLLEFMEKLVGKNQKSIEKQNEFIRNLQRQSNLLLGFVSSNDGFCSDEVGDLPRIPKDDFPELANYIDSIFMWDYNLPDRYWTKIARNGLYELVASERGFWNQLAKKELPQIYIQTLEKMVVSKDYLNSVLNKEYQDFYHFAEDLREYLSQSQKSQTVLEEIGVSCLKTVQETFEAFKLSKCLESKRLRFIDGFELDGFVIVGETND